MAIRQVSSPRATQGRSPCLFCAFQTFRVFSVGSSPGTKSVFIALSMYSVLQAMPLQLPPVPQYPPQYAISSGAVRAAVRAAVPAGVLAARKVSAVRAAAAATAVGLRGGGL